MPTLNWIGRDKIINHHKVVPFQVLDRIYSYDTAGQHEENNNSDNMIIHGDNLVALKSLLPRFEGKIKCIYIDPPYNTGNAKDGTGWKYTDRVDDPIIQKWFDKVVGNEEEDMTRHDKWLCMMYPRLRLLQKLLSDNGIIFISIDDNELSNLKQICDEIFGKNNFYCQFTWISDGNFDNQAKVKVCHEYVLAYAKRIGTLGLPRGIDASVDSNSKIFKSEIRNTIVKNGYKNPPTEIVLKKGFPCTVKELVIRERYDKYPHYLSDAVIQDYKLQNDVVVKSGWSSNAIMLNYMDNDFQPVPDSKLQETTFVITETGNIDMIKKRETTSHVKSVLSGLGSTQNMSNELSKMDIEFKYNKPVNLVKYLINFYLEDGDYVLDSFAGSNVTAHAVLELNNERDMDCHFITIELENYAENITAKRVKKLIGGYAGKLPLDGSFSFYEIGEPLIEDGFINENVEVDKIREYVFFTETKLPYSEKESKGYYLGHLDATAYYFCYEKDKTVALNDAILGSLKPGFDNYVIYADVCYVPDDFLKQHNIVFKKIPRDLGRF